MIEFGLHYSHDSIENLKDHTKSKFKNVLIPEVINSVIAFTNFIQKKNILPLNSVRVLNIDFYLTGYSASTKLMNFPLDLH